MKTLPIADFTQVRAYARTILKRHRGSLTIMLLLYAVAAIASLVPAYVIGLFTNDAVANTLTQARTLHLVEVLSGTSLLYGVFSFLARRRSYIFGEQVFAELREEFIASVLKLPLSVVEQAGTGDLLSRTTSDVEAMSRMVRFAVPEWLVALVQTLLTAAAMILVSPTAAIASVLSLPPIFFATRYYLRYATPGYRRERMSYATLAGTVSETAEGARTVDALQLGQRQLQRIEGNLRENFYAEMYTLLMRMIWFPIVESSFALAVAGTLGWSGLLALHHVITIGAATTVTLYVVQINDPLDRIVAWLDELQLGQSSLARLVGVAMVEDTRPVTGPTPAGEELVVTNVSYAYRSGHNVLHDVSLTIRPGERLAIVGPSGAGKSTLGRLLAGIDGPTQGSLTIGGVSLSDLPLADLRSQVSLVTQEHHVFLGTIRDNLSLAKPSATDDEIRAALDAVDALDWVDLLDAGLDTEVGSTGYHVSPAQAQQIALARLVLANPHTLILDEATALLDPRSARHLERSMNAVLDGRTVIAIAHRLHTAHDADRVCVMRDGRIAELGTHDELVALNGEYAALWHSWRNDAAAS